MEDVERSWNFEIYFSRPGCDFVAPRPLEMQIKYLYLVVYFMDLCESENPIASPINPN